MVVVGVQHVESPSRRSFLLLRIDRFSGFAASSCEQVGIVRIVFPPTHVFP